jgi:hypothetical protein
LVVKVVVGVVVVDEIVVGLVAASTVLAGDVGFKVGVLSPPLALVEVSGKNVVESVV